MLRFRTGRRTALAAALSVAWFGCGEDSSEDRRPRRDGDEPYVRYLAGSSEDVVLVEVDLSVRSVRVGKGRTDALQTWRATLTDDEVTAGQLLFTDAKIANYRTLSEPEPSAAHGGGNGAVGLPSEEAAGASFAAGGEPSVPNAADLDGTSISVVIYPTPSELSRISLVFAETGRGGAGLSELLSYFEALAERYGR